MLLTVFVLTGFPENRSHFWQKVPGDNNEELNLNGEDDENETEDQATDRIKKPVKLPGKSGYFTEATTIHDRYAARPASENPEIEGRLEKICLAQFATIYTPINKLPKKVEIFDKGSEYGCSKVLSCQKFLTLIFTFPIKTLR